MRPFTAGTKKNQLTSTRSIWKKYQSIKPQKNQFYCFKTISEILEAHQTKPLKQTKNQLYYHKINLPRKHVKQSASFKETTKKKISSIVQRNPNMKKALTNNFLSSKQIGKQNSDILNSGKIKTQNEINVQVKFLPYRQQAISVIKQSKILNQTVSTQNQDWLTSKKQERNLKQQDKLKNRHMILRQKQKTKHLAQHEKAQKEQDEQYSNLKNSQLAIQKWQNFQQDITFSMLLNNNR